MIREGEFKPMGEREIREKYGGKLAKAINRAMRAEIPGGNAALDTLTHLSGPAMHSGWKDHFGNPTVEATAYFKHKRQVVDKMEATVRAKWGIPPEDVAPAKPARKRPAKRPTNRPTNRPAKRPAQRPSVRKNPGRRRDR
jgi:hypothetical protein